MADQILKPLQCARRFLLRGGMACLLMVASAAGQNLHFDSTFHNFGRMVQREQRTVRFVFRNTGTESVTVLEPRASCGCTAALVSKSTLAPGDTGSVAVSFTAYAGWTGTVEKTVGVYEHNSLGSTESATLRIRAGIIAEVMPDSGMLRFSAREGERVRLRMPLHSTTGHPLTLDNISLAAMEYVDTSAGDEYHAERIVATPVTDFTLSTEDSELGPGESTDMILEIQTHGKGQINGHVRIALPESEVRIPVVGVVYRNRSPGAPPAASPPPGG